MDISLHKKRIATSIGLAAIPALAILFQGWVLFAVLALFSVLALWEFYDMFRPVGGMTSYKALGGIFTFLLLGAFTIEDPRCPGIILISAFWTSALLFLGSYSKDLSASYKQAAIFLAGLIYIPLNFHFFLGFNRFEIFLVIGAAAISDTAAFYSGTLWGKKKIWPKISPKKSWIGCLGGMSACIVGVTLFGTLFGQAAWWQWILLGAALNIAAQFGDFFESALKRSQGVKDSGTILPGHGGLLDRVDSMLFAVPVYGLIQTFKPFF
ncbi:MAG: phosphatidate cytidylyltransferase [Pseudodesulfovibrio sp.]|nr:phosphatidate cytidylyltransferase [Pseudodesulfovibrio sp.]